MLSLNQANSFTKVTDRNNKRICPFYASRIRHAPREAD